MRLRRTVLAAARPMQGATVATTSVVDWTVTFARVVSCAVRCVCGA